MKQEKIQIRKEEDFQYSTYCARGLEKEKKNLKIIKLKKDNFVISDKLRFNRFKFNQ